MAGRGGGESRLADMQSLSPLLGCDKLDVTRGPAAVDDNVRWVYLYVCTA